MDNFTSQLMGIAFLWIMVGIIIFIVICMFVIYLIKKGVKNAIEETFYSKEFREQLRNDISFAIISAKRQDFQRNYENSIDE